MDTRLTDVLQNREQNYLLPFFWQQGNHTELLEKQIEEIYQSGCRAFCVESRTHEDYCHDGWWRDMDIILREAEKRGMQVWILDDKHFPTGYATGVVESKYPERRKWVLIEKHVDVFGPMKDVALLTEPEDDEQELLGVYAYPHNGKGEVIRDAGFSGEVIDLSDCYRDGEFRADLPEGFFRVFFLYKTRKTGAVFSYINMIDDASCDILLEEVYRPHYAHYAKYFGTTLAGFFSDEPEFGNRWFGAHSRDDGHYGYKIGSRGLGLPWSDAVLPMLKERLGENALAFLPGLWFDIEEVFPAAREAYMDVITRLYQKCFSEKLGNWCAEHGCMYIGHIIEDMNAHAHLSTSAGHFFRALEGQHMAGMDIVLHQVLPGFGDYITASTLSTGTTDPKFFHYSLPKLAASQAHLNPQMKGRAMCEVFGAFGWAESVPYMKWLMDYLLVRGVNHFVPHAFSPNFPNPDCPPHFGNLGKDASFDGFSALMNYTNKVSHLLYGARHHANAAVLYHAETEWYSSENDFDVEDEVTKALYDHHIDYDILPVDYLEKAEVRDGKLLLNGESYDCLIAARAKAHPECVEKVLHKLSDAGLEVVFSEERPANCAFGRVLPYSELASFMEERGMTDLSFKGGRQVRAYHASRGETHYFMFFNESVKEETFEVTFPVKGDHLRVDLLHDEIVAGHTDGSLSLSLLPNASVIFVFGDFEEEILKKYAPKAAVAEKKPLDLVYDVSLSDLDDLSAFKFYKKSPAGLNINGRNELPDFAGRIRYEATFEAKKASRVVLDFGEVHETLALTLNGESCGVRINAPFSFDVTDLIRDGENKLCAEVGTTPAYRLKDPLSHFVMLPPTGILGDVTIGYGTSPEN